MTNVTASTWRRSLVIDQGSSYPNNASLALTLPPGAAGVDCTIAAMLALVHDSKAHPSQDLISAAAEIKRDAGDRRREPLQLYKWMRKRFRFRKDPDGIELLRHPDQMLQAMRTNPRGRKTAGDCDELATLAVAILLQLGHRPVFIVMDAGRGRFHHVFFGVRSEREVIPFNPQEGTPPGQWPASVRRKVYQV